MWRSCLFRSFSVRSVSCCSMQMRTLVAQVRFQSLQVATKLNLSEPSRNKTDQVGTKVNQSGQIENSSVHLRTKMDRRTFFHKWRDVFTCGKTSLVCGKTSLLWKNVPPISVFSQKRTFFHKSVWKNVPRDVFPQCKNVPWSALVRNCTELFSICPL